MEEIFILRHAEAEDLSEDSAITDFDRKLTEDGIKKTNKLGLLFNNLKEDVNLILSSPYVRAKETASIFAATLEPKTEVKTVDFLRVGSSVKEIAKGLMPYTNLKKIVLVGHAPDLGIFIGKLIGAERIKLKKGAMAKVKLNNNFELSGELNWLITPKIINKFKIKQDKLTTAL